MPLAGEWTVVVRENLWGMTKKTLTARTPEDLLALVPFVLGFHPAQSIVMLTFGGQQNLQARVDIPRSAEDVEEVVESLGDPARANDVEAVVLVAYARESALVTDALVTLEFELEAAGIAVIEMLRVDAGRWFGVRPQLASKVPTGVPFALEAHRFTAQSVYDGNVIHASREDLADSLIGTDTDLIDRVEAAALVAATRWSDVQLPAEAQWIRDLVLRHVRERSTPGTDDLGRLLVGLQDVELRDVVWGKQCAENATGHLDFWREVVRRTPQPLLAPPSTLLAFAAWLSGQGALAWCAVDRAVLVEPDYSLAQTITEILAKAVPPSLWQPPEESALLA